MDELTVEQAAAELRVTPGHVRKLVQRGVLAPSVHYPGRVLRFCAAAIARYGAERRRPGRPRKEGAPDAP